MYIYDRMSTKEIYSAIALLIHQKHFTGNYDKISLYEKEIKTLTWVIEQRTGIDIFS